MTTARDPIVVLAPGDLSGTTKTGQTAEAVLLSRQRREAPVDILPRASLVRRQICNAGRMPSIALGGLARLCAAVQRPESVYGVIGRNRIVMARITNRNYISSVFTKSHELQAVASPHL